MLQGNGRNLEIVRTDPVPAPLELSADFGAFRRGTIVEGQCEVWGQERVESAVFAWRAGTSFSAVPQFVNDDGTKENLIRIYEAPSLKQLQVPAAQKLNAAVRIGPARGLSLFKPGDVFGQRRVQDAPVRTNGNQAGREPIILGNATRPKHMVPRRAFTCQPEVEGQPIIWFASGSDHGPVDSL